MGNLNSPKANNLNKCYKDFVAVDKVSDFWSITEQEIDEFVRVRGDIAHNGRGAQYIRVNHLEKLMISISEAVIENDNAILDHMKETFIGGRSPWYRKSC